MGHDDDRQIRPPELAGLEFAEGREDIRAHRDRWYAAFLDLDGVVDTPRRARASITASGEHHLALGGESDDL